MLVSIVVPAYNAERTLGTCLEACIRQSHPEIEVIVIDDGSADGTARVAGQFEGVRYIRQENAGPAAARNRGAREARGEIVAFTDSDCVPRPDWIASLIEGFEDGVAGVGGTYAIENSDSLLARLIQEEIAVRHAGMGTEADFLGSFNVAYRRAAFEAAGGFDASFREASCEDNELAYRLHAGGWKLRFRAEAVVGHWHPSRPMAYLRTQARHGFWRVKLYAMHPGRASGDCYAGWPDLLTPPLALAAFALAAPALLGWWSAGPWIGACYAAMIALQFALHGPMAWRMMRHAGRGEMAWFLGLAVLRDFARATGMAHGLWAFFVRGKERGQ